MRKVWVLVANRVNATIYRAENTNTLVEHETFLHKEGHQHERDLITDRHGKSSYSTVRKGDTFERSSEEVKESIKFAEEIAKFINKAFSKNEFEHLYILAPAPFLGCLRDCLDPKVSKAVQNEIPKDLISLKPKEIREYLPLVL